MDEDPWTQLPGVSQKELSHWEKNATSKKIPMPSLWEARAMLRTEASKTLKSLAGKHQRSLNVDRVLDAMYALPFVSVDNVTLSQTVEKATGVTTGEVSLNVSISQEASHHQDHQKNRARGPMSLALVLGTPLRKTLLTQQTIGFGQSNATVKKSVKLAFDWNAANADGGESGGAVILRLLFDEVRGLDSELLVPLR